MTDFKYRVLGDWSKNTADQQKAVADGQKGIRQIVATAKTELANLRKLERTGLGEGQIRGELDRLRTLATALGAARGDASKAQAQGVRVAAADLDAQINALKKAEARLSQRAGIDSKSPYYRRLERTVDVARADVGRGQDPYQRLLSPAERRQQQQASREAARRANDQSRRAQKEADNIRNEADKRRLAAERAEALVKDPALAALRDREVRAKQDRDARDARQRAENFDPQDAALTSFLAAQGANTARASLATLNRDPAALALQAMADVETRRTKAAQAAAAARYNQQDPTASLRESQDIGVAEAEKRRQAAQNQRAIEEKTIPFVKEIAKNQAESARLANYREQFARREAAATLYKGPLGKQALQAGAEASVLTARNKLDERLARDKAFNADPKAKEGTLRDEAYLDAQKRRDAIKKSLLTEQELAKNSGVMIAQQAEAAALENRRNLEKRRAIAAAATQADADLRASAIGAETARTEREKLAVIKSQNRVLQLGLSNQSSLSKTQQAEAAVAKQTLDVRRQILKAQMEQRQLQAIVNQQALSGGALGGTRFQRLQSRFSAGRGGELRLPQEFQTFGQFAASKALTTAGFAFSGAILYGSISALREMVKEASELEKQLAIVDANFRSAGKSAEEFGEFRETIIDISKETGIAADELTRIGRSLLGVFRIRDEEAPITEQDKGANQFAAAESARVSAQFSTVTGVAPKQITDEFVALYRSFEDLEGLSFRQLADQLIAVEDESGVFADQLLDIASSLAPVAANLGLSADELIRYSAAATQGSGKSPAAIADGLNRFITGLPDKSAAIADIYQRSPTLTQEDYVNLQRAVQSGETSQVLNKLIEDYQKIPIDLRDDFANNVIGERNAQAVIGLFANPQLALRPIESDNALNERFKKTLDTVEVAFARARAAAEEFGEALFQAGLGDALKSLATVAGGLVVVLTKLLQAFNFLNEKTLGIASEIIGVVVATRLLNKAFTGLGRMSLFKGRVGSSGPVVLSGIPGPDGGPLVVTGTGAGRLTGARGRLSQVARGISSSRAAQAVKAGVMGAPNLFAGGAILGLSSYMDLNSTTAKENQDLEQEIASYTIEQLERGTKLKDSNLTGFSKFLTGEKSDSAIYRDALQRRQNPGRGDLLVEIGFEEARKAAGREGYGGNFGLTEADYNELIAQLRAGSVDDDVENKFLEIQAAYEANGNVSSGYTEGLKKQAGQQQAIDAGVEASLSLEETEKEIELGLELIKTGDATYGAVKEKIAERTRLLTLMSEGAKAAGKPDPEVERLLAESQRQQAELADLTFKQYTETAQKINDLVGNDSTKTGIELNRFLLSGFATDVSNETRYEAAENLFKGLESQLQDEVSGATNVQDAIARIREARANLDPEARFALIRQQIDQPAFSDAIEGIGAPVEDIVSDLITLFDGGDMEGQIAEYQDQLAGLDRLRELMSPETWDQLYGTMYDNLQGWLTILQSGVVDPTKLSEAAEAAESLKAFANVKRNIQLNNELANSSSTNPLAIAQNNAQAAADVLEQAKSIQDGSPEAAAILSEAQIDYNKAMLEVDAAQEAIDMSFYDLEAAKVARDPVASAQVALRRADAMAQAAGDDIQKQNAAAAARIAAQQQMQDAQNDILFAQLELQQAQVEGDPVAAAQIGVQLAQLAVSTAYDEASKLRALGDKIRADRALQDAILAVQQAQLDVALAMANAAGDTVRAAEIGLEKADKALSAARAKGDKSAELSALADQISAKAALRDARLSDQTSDIDFALTMEQITTGQAIQQLELLLKVPDLTKRQIQELKMKIKSLRDGAGLSQFNTPSELNLPTIYEVRRLDQLAGGTYQSARTMGGNVSNDNRNINIVINAKNTIEAEAALQVVKDTLGSAPRAGVDYKIY